jgi:hypothetical protein
VSTGELLGRETSAPRARAARSSAPRTVYRDRPVSAVAPTPAPVEPHKVTVIKAGKQKEEEAANEKNN